MFIALQKFTNRFDVNCEPRSECNITLPLASGFASTAALTVLTARYAVMFLSVMLATMLLSYKSIIEQLYITLPSFKNK